MLILRDFARVVVHVALVTAVFMVRACPNGLIESVGQHLDTFQHVLPDLEIKLSSNLGKTNRSSIEGLCRAKIEMHLVSSMDFQLGRDSRVAVVVQS
jgi:hypothetical protein